MSVRWLTAAEVERCLPMAEAIDAMAEAFEAVHAGRVAMPLRLGLEAPAAGGTTLFMPAHDPGLGYTALKVVSVYPGNPARGLPAIAGLVILLDAGTGRPLAVMDGRALTALRTGAASGIATRLLARPDASVLAVLGAGAQAPYQVLAVCAVRPIRQVRIHNRTRARAEALAGRLAARLGPAVEVRVAATPAEAARGAHVICTATAATEPLLGAADVAPGTHVNAVGSFRRGMRELARDLVVRARPVFVDQREAAREEAGELIEALEAGALAPGDLVELGAVLAGTHPGRVDADQVTIFKSCGLAAQDLYAAARVWERAQALGVGRDVAL
ncbi:ornithine cyclodeaminase family protein [Thermaerobacter composti]|uniref:Ornithine cyclodeaminase family protein n=1 Tax=Thermaerobacter composti TaxID=554949 RepID=A0ABZ0QRG0_9FIRM|nr:ornithine cyclodeaminase family protein [Thermaerobacter composti]PZN07170.1 MAG: ornithine cyclodeaminase [Bacillota bacterium]WPD19628.1 ornithine cyclodeaminase family protein [Thermaerobacter composti]